MNMMKKCNLGPLICVALGVLVLILALALQPPAASFHTHNYQSSTQFQLSYSFGADFYTEMFGVTYKALQQLNGISSDLASNFRTLEGGIAGYSRGLFDLALWGIRWITAAIGLMMIGIGACRLFREAPAEAAPEGKTALPATPADEAREASAAETMAVIPDEPEAAPADEVAQDVPDDAETPAEPNDTAE